MDSNPHIYSAYSDNPETSRAFAAFKADNSGHLKLLYCIDMLNEGIQVDCNAVVVGNTVVPGGIKVASGTVYEKKIPHGPDSVDGLEYRFVDGM